MDFIVIFAAMAANVITARIFKPYTNWIVSLFNELSEFFGKKTYKKASRFGVIFAIAVIVIILAGVEIATSALYTKSYVYRYIIYAVTVYFTVCVGQIVGMMSKLSKNLSDADYCEQLMKELFIAGVKKQDDTNRTKFFVKGFARVLAEKTVMPLLLIVVFGPAVTLAYAFINTMARSDLNENVKKHGFADFAIKLNNIVSIPAYIMLSFALFIANWVFSIKSARKKMKFVDKCEYRLLLFGKSDKLTKAYVNTLKWLTVGMVFVILLALLCVYIFVQAVVAGMGLDDYIDYWNKHTSE